MSDLSAPVGLDAKARPPRSRALVGVTALAALVILIGLGNWQTHRLAWKENLLAEIDARVHAAPQPIPSEADWPKLVPDDYEYRHVTVTGTLLNQDEALVFAGTSTVDGNPAAAYFVLTPLQLADGSYVIINRGRVPESAKASSSRAAGELTGAVTITGLMRSPEGRNPFTPADEPAKGLWFTRDPALIASSFSLARAAPFSIDADATPVPGGLPAGGTTNFDIPNNHLGYAFTWYGLAATLVVCLAVYGWRNRRRPG